MYVKSISRVQETWQRRTGEFFGVVDALVGGNRFSMTLHLALTTLYFNRLGVSRPPIFCVDHVEKVAC